MIKAFATGTGSNLLTITCADPETFAGATADPEKYDLLRVRMGGWSEFFVAMFPGPPATAPPPPAQRSGPGHAEPDPRAEVSEYLA